MLRFDDQVALVTGAGRGLGKEYALLLASRGAKVLVNDLGGTYDGTGANVRVADQVVAEIRAAGGIAAANYDSVVDGEKVVQAALDAFGGKLDIVIANAGILTPEPWDQLSLESFERTMKINVTGVFTVMKAAWPVLVRQKYGRVIVASSPTVFGGSVPGYAASKAALLGLAHSLQLEAHKCRANININSIFPFASTRMVTDYADDVAKRRGAMGKKVASRPPAKLLAMSHPSRVAPMVVWLCHQDCNSQAKMYEAGAGYFGQLRFQRSADLFCRLGAEEPPTPEDVRDGQDTLQDFANGDIPPVGDGSMGGRNALQRVMGRLSRL